MIAGRGIRCLGLAVDEDKIRAAIKRGFIPWLQAKHVDVDVDKEVDKVIVWLKIGPHYSEGYFDVRP